jgi:hypothetical protein
MTGTPPHRTDPYALTRASAARLAELSGATFDAAIVLGSGWLSTEEGLPSPMAKLRPPAVADKLVPYFHQRGTFAAGQVLPGRVVRRPAGRGDPRGVPGGRRPGVGAGRPALLP